MKKLLLTAALALAATSASAQQFDRTLVGIPFDTLAIVLDPTTCGGPEANEGCYVGDGDDWAAWSTKTVDDVTYDVLTVAVQTAADPGGDQIVQYVLFADYLDGTLASEIGLHNPTTSVSADVLAEIGDQLITLADGTTWIPTWIPVSLVAPMRDGADLCTGAAEYGLTLPDQGDTYGGVTPAHWCYALPDQPFWADLRFQYTWNVSQPWADAVAALFSNDANHAGRAYWVNLKLDADGVLQVVTGFMVEVNVSWQAR
jgi:hypothetical protein